MGIDMFLPMGIIRPTRTGEVTMEKLRNYLKSLSTPEKEAFAKRCGTTLGYLRKAISLNNRFDVNLCIAVERESSGVVRCEDVRPDVAWEFLREVA